jgi:hypothetical protein
MTAQMEALPWMLTRLDHNVAIRVLRDHVHMIHVMHMWTHMRVCFVVTQRELMLRWPLATVRT